MTRSAAHPLLVYSDVLPHWNYAVEHGGARIKTTSPRAAIKLRFRLNYARGAMRREGVVQYDTFTMHLDGATVVIAPRASADILEVSPLSGAPEPEPQSFDLDQGEC